MISNDLQKVLDAIHNLRSRHKTWTNSAEGNRENEKRFKRLAESDEEEAHKLELEIETLSLELRKVLSNQPSTIVVEPPSSGETEQVGREG